jgi:uncharacterized membrane protein YccC
MRFTDIPQRLVIEKSSFFYFLRGEHFSDALRNTVSVIVPLFVFFAAGNKQAAIGIAATVLLICLTDLPDNRAHKIRTAVSSVVVFTLTALIVSLTARSPSFSAITLVACAFFLSMLGIFGEKMFVIGSVAIVLATVVFGMKPADPYLFTAYVATGGIWYFLLSIIQSLMNPYRSLNHAIIICLKTSTFYLREKAKYYNLNIPFDHHQTRAIDLHVKINQQHEYLRSLLLTDNLTMNIKNKNGQVLLGRALLLIDLHERLNSLSFDYTYIRKTLAGAAALHTVHRLINLLADEMEMIYKKSKVRTAFLLHDFDSGFFAEKRAQLDVESRILNKTQLNIVGGLAKNLDQIAEVLVQITSNVVPGKLSIENNSGTIAFEQFVDRSAPVTRSALSISSPVFRFALRLAISFAITFLFLGATGKPDYGYWTFLTIAVVSRPGFAQTKKRNTQRLQGSLSGLSVAVLLCFLISSNPLILALVAVSLLGFYSTNRLNYAVSAFFATLTVTMVLVVYNGQLNHIMLSRFIFTLAGCFVSLVTIYLFPIWDANRLHDMIGWAITDSCEYFKASVEKHTTAVRDITRERLSRKLANVAIYRFSQALDNASVEPLAKRINIEAMRSMRHILYKINAVITSVYLSPDDFRLSRADEDQVAKITAKLLDRNAVTDQIADQNYQPLAQDHNEAQLKTGMENFQEKLAHLDFLSRDFLLCWKEINR